MRRILVLGAFVLLLPSAVAYAGVLTATTPVAVSSEAASPLAGCTADNIEQQDGTVFLNSEVEPFVDVNPTDADGDGMLEDNVVATWQQDRWSNGASRGNLVGFSFDEGASWTTVTQTKSSICTGGPAEYLRASDPWVSFSPDGGVYLMSLVVGDFEGHSLPPFDAMIASKSEDGGATWSDPIELIRSEDLNTFNDKNTLTADPNDADFAYAVWDRLEIPRERAAEAAFENTLGFRGPTWFARTSDGGVTWEEARMIFDPGQENQTLGNQIAVLPDNGSFDGELVNVFNLIVNFREGRFIRGGRFRAAVIRSADQGETWSRPIVIDEMRPVTPREPQEDQVIRAGEIIPDIAVDSTSGNLYLVWMDGRFSGGDHNDIAFSMSSDGGVSWSAPVKVNQTPDGLTGNAGHAFTASVHVAADGTVGVSYYDFRNQDPATAASETDHFLVHCHVPSATEADGCGDDGWSETRVTDASFDLLQAPVARGLFLGDYVGLDNAGNAFAPLFTQSNSAADPATQYYSSVSGP